jgi:hypothetical protein
VVVETTRLRQLTMAARALIRRAFTQLGTDHVSADAMAVNRRSRRVTDKAGLSFARTEPPRWRPPTQRHAGRQDYLRPASCAERNPHLYSEMSQDRGCLMIR